ncbi:unnamed protein product (macronuclear) [Paramecium tetraurelia]|uniref:Tubulin-tyrosine ligase family protein n=1 Tax=Paramecium tetraurelia TaxID=5888 RepID=A0CP54_PARTE|nr:uncharacterized protein GSPATT00008962001 [Paramecium tetraurelia]CAK72571.1 unnamed protein product [Paramecium tetraurelia]|eukprot:XP_001439968.1 hypothetical protein (macronuclear) [Paramecium tetraurelia strain d4-2]
MFGKAIILIVSILSHLLIYNFIRTSLVYKNRQEVDQILTYLNKYLTNTYYAPSANHSAYNSILVKPEYDYCKRSDLYKFYHPDVIMTDTYTFREVKGVIRETLRSSYFDCIPQMYLKMKNSQSKHAYSNKLIALSKHILPEQLTLPFTYYDQLIHKFKVGQASLCLFQKYNHLPSRHVLSHKDNLMNNQYKYIDSLREKGVDQECIQNATFIPKTYRLFQKQDCKEFFDYLNSKEYKDKIAKEGPQFITKVGLEVHRGRGIKVLFPEETKKLQEKYKNGKSCGADHSLLVAQQYIGNPMLFNNHKIEFRIYWVLASTNPIIAYAYDKTLIRRCIAPFDKFSLNKEAHVCNTAIVKSTLKQRGADLDLDDENADESELFIDWKLDYLQDLLLQQGKIKDKKWLQNYLYPTVDRMIIHSIKSVEDQITRDSRLAEFFAADFILTDDLKIHIMEINYNPQTLKTTPARQKQHAKMAQDMIDIQNAYLRSKYLRFKKITPQNISQNEKRFQTSRLNYYTKKYRRNK